MAFSGTDQGPAWSHRAPQGAQGRADKTAETLSLTAPLLCGALFCLAGAAHRVAQSGLRNHMLR